MKTLFRGVNWSHCALAGLGFQGIGNGTLLLEIQIVLSRLAKASSSSLMMSVIGTIHSRLDNSEVTVKVMMRHEKTIVLEYRKQGS